MGSARADIERKDSAEKAANRDGAADHELARQVWSKTESAAGAASNKSDATAIDEKGQTGSNPDVSRNTGSETVGNVTETEVRNYSGPIHPYAAGIGGRLMLLSVAGRLTANNTSVLKLIESSGPVGQQLLNRYEGLKARGWSLGSMGFNDPILKMEAPGVFKRTWRMLTLGGYHYDHFHDRPVRRIGYNNLTNVVGSLVGSNFGTGDPVKHTAAIVAHELAHEDGTLYEHREWKKLPKLEQQTLAKRLLATETRAILTQLHVGGIIGDNHLATETLRNALKTGDLGGYIHDIWGKSGDPYGPFKTIPRAEASAFVNEFIDNTFGKDIIDKKGTVRAFDVYAGADRQVGTTSVDAEMRAKLFRNVEGAQPVPGASERLTSMRGGGAMLKGLQIAGAYGVLSMFTDVNKAFEHGAVSGVGRTARVAADWGGMELGSLAGIGVMRSLSSLMPQSRALVLAGPVFTVFGGIGGSFAVDKFVGQKIEDTVLGLNKLF